MKIKNLTKITLIILSCTYIFASIIISGSIKVQQYWPDWGQEDCQKLYDKAKND